MIKPPVASPFRASSQQAVRDAVDDRRTPPSIFGPLHARYDFTLDAAANAENALAPRFFTRETDGLLRSWKGERVWCNPPFSRLEAWVAKAWQEVRNGCPLVVMLIPANRSEQPFWQQYVEPFRDRGADADGISLTARFLAGRTQFITPGQPAARNSGAPFGCVLLTWDSRSLASARLAEGV